MRVVTERSSPGSKSGLPKHRRPKEIHRDLVSQKFEHELPLERIASIPNSFKVPSESGLVAELGEKLEVRCTAGTSSLPRYRTCAKITVQQSIGTSTDGELQVNTYYSKMRFKTSVRNIQTFSSKHIYTLRFLNLLTHYCRAHSFLVVPRKGSMGPP